MITNFVRAGAAAAALLMTAAAFQTASAVPLPQTGVANADGVTLVRRGGGHGHRGPRFHGRPHGFGRPHFGRHLHPRPRVRFYPRAYYYGGYLPYAYPYYFDDDYGVGACDGLRIRAERTGSRYWWTRYRRCVAAYD